MRLLTVLALAAIAGCGPASPPPTADATDESPRLVTLAPHLAELVFAAGAGNRLVGVSAYTDYPEEAAALPLVGDAFTVDQERLRLLAPDAVLAWQSGMPAHRIAELETAGFNVVPVMTASLADISKALLTIGELAGTAEVAAAEAARFEAGLHELAAEYAERRPIRVFYQISSRPLYTISGEHFISELITLCGGRNVFADLNELAPAVDVEAVLARRPEAIVGGSSGGGDAFAEWRRFETLPAVRDGNLLAVDAVHLGRASTRLADAGRRLCAVIDDARGRAYPSPSGIPSTKNVTSSVVQTARNASEYGSMISSRSPKPMPGRYLRMNARMTPA